MKLKTHLAPHIRSGMSNRAIMGDVVVTLGAIYIMAFFYYGQRALALGAVSVITCVAADILCCMLRKRKINSMDYSAIVTGLVLPLLMPATVQYQVVVVAGLFAICVVKQPFGGVGHNLFNPAAGGFAFALVCWPKQLFSYPAPFLPLELVGDAAAAVPFYNSTAFTMYVGGVPQVDAQNLVLGLSPGPMGTTNLLVVAACLLYLVMRRTVRLQQPLFMLSTMAVIAWFFPRTLATGWQSVFLELAAMPTLFFVTFLFSDPVTTPARGSTKALYAAVAGLVVMLFRHIGGYEIAEPFALLLMNALAPGFDAVAEFINTIVRRATFETQATTIQPGLGEDDEEA